LWVMPVLMLNAPPADDATHGEDAGDDCVQGEPDCPSRRPPRRRRRVAGPYWSRRPAACMSSCRDLPIGS
jgi:hypothetical protein